MPVRRRPHRRHPNADRYLSPEEKLAHVICGAVHAGGCHCEQSSNATCHTMIWAAKRARAHLAGKPLPPREEPL